jgi:hypothetical protein
MNTNISWTDFDGDRFQCLGNSIVYTFVSNRAKIYNAPGNDGGIDQMYTGTILFNLGCFILSCPLFE